MTNRLKQYFPMLRTRTEIMEIIIKDETLKTLFDSWETEFQEEFLNICTGISGVKVLYDFMIKEILNPEAVPERNWRTTVFTAKPESKSTNRTAK